MEKRLYHILTPVPPEELRNVNCLLVGAISVPQCVFKSQVGTSTPRAALQVAGHVHGRESHGNTLPCGKLTLGCRSWMRQIEHQGGLRGPGP